MFRNRGGATAGASGHVGTPSCQSDDVTTAAMALRDKTSTSSRPLSASPLTCLHMALVPLPAQELEQLLSVGPPTGEQYAAYWGRTPRERYGRTLESAIVTVLGVLFSYFLSFVMGSFVATFLGTLFFFWGILSPQFKATQRNWEFLGGRPLVDPWKSASTDSRSSRRRRNDNSNGPTDEPDNAGLYGALYLGSIHDVCVVEGSTDRREYDLADFRDYRMETDELEQYTGEPYLLRVRLRDAKGRELQVHAHMSEEYVEVQSAMPVVAVLLSTRHRFDQLAAITDLYVPNADCWIGDYPYLNRVEIQSLLAQDDEIWQSLEKEAMLAAAEDQAWQSSDVYQKEERPVSVDEQQHVEDDNDDKGYERPSDYEKVRVQRRGRRR